MAVDDGVACDVRPLVLWVAVAFAQAVDRDAVGGRVVVAAHDQLGKGEGKSAARRDTDAGDVFSNVLGVGALEDRIGDVGWAEDFLLRVQAAVIDVAGEAEQVIGHSRVEAQQKVDALGRVLGQCELGFVGDEVFAESFAGERQTGLVCKRQSVENGDPELHRQSVE